MANVVRRYQRTVSVLALKLQRLLPVGAFVSSSAPEPGEMVDLTVENTVTNYATDTDAIMAAEGFSFVAEAPATTLEQAAASEIPPVTRVKESGGTELAIGAISSGQVLQRSGSSIIGVSGGGSSFDLRDVFVFDHFQSSNADLDEIGLMGWRLFTTGAGASASFASGVAGRPGVLVLSGGTAAAGRAAVALGDSAGAGGRILLAGTNPISYEFLFRFPSATDFLATNLESVITGFGLEWTEDAEQTNGLYVRYAPAAPISDTDYKLVAVTGGVSTVASSGIVPVAGTWVRFKIIFTPGTGTAALEINGSQVASLTTNVPTGVSLGVGQKIRGLGAVAPVGQWDYVLGMQVTDKEGA